MCALSSEHIQRKLLSKDFTFQQALDIALAEEMANVNVRQISSGHQSSDHGNHGGAVNKVGQRGKGTHTALKPCYRCGFDNHLSSECHYRVMEYFKCRR